MEIITWTPERVDRLTELFEEGLPTAEIGRRLGLTKNAVIGKLHRNFFEFNGPSCLWPHGHPDDADFHFCGARPLAGKPYCAEHAAVAYVRPKEEKAKAA
jgi:GcrA cell cycle regulator